MPDRGAKWGRLAVSARSYGYTLAPRFNAIHQAFVDRQFPSANANLLNTRSMNISEGREYLQHGIDSGYGTRGSPLVAAPKLATC
jgi:hypothetical protein